LAQFDREGAKVSEILLGRNLPKEELRTSAKVTDEQTRWKGHVCFTHFIYLARSNDNGPLITPNLLRYAYRRTAAIVVDDGRKGIDWIIPVRVAEDEFVGLCGQDKNRNDETLEHLGEITTEATHHKVKPSYFLTETEKNLFIKELWSLDWPAILLSIHVKEPGAELAKESTIQTRSKSMVDQYPCIILTGLGYKKIMCENFEAEQALCELRDQVEEVPDVYRQKIPLTYGMKSNITPQKCCDIKKGKMHVLFKIPPKKKLRKKKGKM
jgi:hypothetical protein